MATRRSRKTKKKRVLTPEESLSIIQPFFENDKFLKIENHRYYPYKDLGENVYRFTVNILSLDILASLMEHPQIKDVYFHPAAPNPGSGIDGISLIYKVYLRYHFK